MCGIKSQINFIHRKYFLHDSTAETVHAHQSHKSTENTNATILVTYVVTKLIDKNGQNL